MDTINLIVGSLLRWFYLALAFLPPYVPLAILSVLAGAGMLCVFKKSSNPKRIRSVKRLVQAHLLEMRLFRDEPGVVWNAQKSLVTSNARYIGLMLQPAVWISLPLALLLVHLEAFHGRTPLSLNRDAIVTMGMKFPVDVHTLVPRMMVPEGIVAVTPPVRVLGEKQISWRIRPIAQTSGRLRFVTVDATLEKEIETGGGPRFTPGLRTSSLLESIWHPDEPRIASSVVDWIDVQYPRAEMRIFGIQLHWVLWFTILSMVFAVIFRKPFGVVF